MIPQYITTRLELNNKHHYQNTLNMNWLPGVTGILDQCNKPWLKPWVAKVNAEYVVKILKKYGNSHNPSRIFGEKPLDLLYRRGKKQHTIVRDGAADIGTKIHTQLDNYVCGRPLTLDVLTKGPVEYFIRYAENKKIKWVMGDTKVSSNVHMYGGSFDALSETEDGELLIWDFKTSNQISSAREYCYQVAAYSVAFQEQYATEIAPHARICRLGKFKPEIEILDVSDIKTAWRGFSACLELHKLSELNHYSAREFLRPPKTIKPRKLNIKTTIIK